MPWRDTLCTRLTPRIAAALRALPEADARRLREIRVRIGESVELAFVDKSREVPPAVDAREMDALLAALSGYALYACERQMAEGYIPLPGGHRAGVCGRLVCEDGAGLRMSAVTSVCVRVSRSVPGACAPFREQLVDGRGLPRRVLLLGPPGCGKTTALRDAAQYLADERGLHVAVADERQELFPDPRAGRVDVLAGVDKATALRLLLRSMAPQVLVTDEVGRPRDVGALLDAARCGVGLLASAHAADLREAAMRPALRALFDARAFDRCVLLDAGAGVTGVYDGAGERVAGQALGERGGRVWPDGTSP